MTIKEILLAKQTSLSFEIFPPKQQTGYESVRAAARELAALRPDFMSITYGAAGSAQTNSAQIAADIESFGTPALAHLTCIGKDRAQLDASIANLKEKNIRSILALRGDKPADGTGTIPGFDHASDLVTLLKRQGFCVGGACYPEGHPESANRDADLDNLRHKVDAGVDFLTTQMFFDNDMLYTYLYRLRSRGINVPVLAGIMPITSASQVSRMVRLSNAFVPRRLLAICDRFAEKPDALWQAGIAYATDQIIDLVSNGVRGIHIYTMNKPAVAKAILCNVSKIFKD